MESTAEGKVKLKRVDGIYFPNTAKPSHAWLRIPTQDCAFEVLFFFNSLLPDIEMDTYATIHGINFDQGTI